MIGFYGFVKKIVSSFSKEELQYAFTGALAASFYGIPRTTADVDILVVISVEDAKSKLASALSRAGLQFDAKKIDNALTSGYRIATFISKDSPYKVDVILSDEIRKRQGTIAKIETFFQIPEDLILAKLRMIKATVQKEKALKDEEDVKAILRFTQLDKGEIEKQAKKEGTLEVWKRLSK